MKTRNCEGKFKFPVQSNKLEHEISNNHLIIVEEYSGRFELMCPKCRRLIFSYSSAENTEALKKVTHPTYICLEGGYSLNEKGNLFCRKCFFEFKSNLQKRLLRVG